MIEPFQVGSPDKSCGATLLIFWVILDDLFGPDDLQRLCRFYI